MNGIQCTVRYDRVYWIFKVGNQRLRKVGNQRLNKVGNQRLRKVGNQRLRKVGNQRLRKAGLGISSFQKNFGSLRSFPFFIKERSDLLVLFRSL